MMDIVTASYSKLGRTVEIDGRGKRTDFEFHAVGTRIIAQWPARSTEVRVTSSSAPKVHDLLTFCSLQSRVNQLNLPNPQVIKPQKEREKGFIIHPSYSNIRDIVRLA